MKRVFVFVLTVVLVLGSICVPASAKAKNSKNTVTTNGIIAPIGDGWTEQERDNGAIIFSDKDSDELLYLVWSIPAKNNSGATKLAKVLSKKSSKTKVIKAISKMEILSELKISKKDVKLKKDSAGNYMAIVEYSVYTEQGHLVIRNIDNRFIAIYGVGIEGSGSIPAKAKKTVLKYAKKIVADEHGMTLTLLGDLVLPYDDGWTLVRDSRNYKEYGYDGYEYATFTIYDDNPDSEIGIYVRADYADSDDDTVKVATLLKDKSNFEELKALLTELLLIPVDEMDEQTLENLFSMEPDGHGSYYVTISMDEGIVVFRIVEGKYIIMCQGMSDMDDEFPKEITDQIIKLVKDAFIL